MYGLSVTLIMRSNYNTHQIKHIFKLIFECNYTLTKHKAWQTSFNCSFAVFRGEKFVIMFSYFRCTKLTGTI